MLRNSGSSLLHLLFHLIIISSVFAYPHSVVGGQEEAAAWGELCEISKSHLWEQKGGMCLSYCTQSLMLLLSDVIFLHGQMIFAKL